MAEVYCGDESVVLDAHAVVRLVLFFQASQDGDALGGRGLVNHYLLESALQGLVLLEVLLVLVQGGGAYRAQFATGQRRLQYIGSVHGTGRTACSHQGVDFVDEQDDFAVRLHNLLHHPLQTLLEFALILCAGYQRTHIERKDFAAL